ncbi:S41 family peptidase [Neolewinella litorea]|uniref:Peptidase S41 n=1 Tax=Neolewinella litorea TaxID=2562452 RepID=A0A4V3XLS2_9BACT|nr:S41 family peptidase [Neolewinella litorea]THH41733.1 peptidase S41 [Neolewinella litorea]
MKSSIFLPLLLALCFPLNGLYGQQHLTPDQRIYGLVQFWTEVKYNFAYFDHVPELDWDHKLQEYLPRVRAEQSDADYYRLLERLCAELRDGHTNIYPPAYVTEQRGTTPVQLKYIEDQFVVVNLDNRYREVLPLGSIITGVNGQRVTDYVAARIYPYISASGDHVRGLIASYLLLGGPVDEAVEVAYLSPEGGTGQATLHRQPQQAPVSWVRDMPQLRPASFRMLDATTGYLALNTFMLDEVVDSFDLYRPLLEKCQSLVIDLRENGGGNSTTGYAILEHFTRKPLLTSKWRTREHRAAYKAWGYWPAHADPRPTDEGAQEVIRYYEGNQWFESPPDTIYPAEVVFDLPVIVLVSHQTGSAAEDFLVAADALPQFTFVGEPSFGSTGQPLFVDLPGGGQARICTKRDTYPDGREFVGPGVQVDVAVAPTVADYLAGKDVVLERALTLVRTSR